MNLNATILGQAIAFIMFVLFCMKYVWPPIMAMIEQRQKEIADAIAAAEYAKKELKLVQANEAEYLKNVKEEAQMLIEQAQKRKAQIMDEAKSEAEQERKAIISRAQVEIQAEYKRTREKLCQQIAILAMAVAEKIIESSVDESTNSALVNKCIAELERGKGSCLD